ncbi:MAG TPA: HAD hydrolase-like protein [Acetobacteraceae bacterium]|nr:HAD hydrolase-like protein [Acetobacteraceae bacterium]
MLDLDGTLVDTVPDLAASLNRVMAARGFAPFSVAETASMVGDGVAKLVERALAARGAAFDPAAVAAYSADYNAHVAVETKVFPGVVETLGALAREGWRLAVCTNKPGLAAHRLLEVLGLAALFAAVGAGDSFPVRKPDPAHLLATLAAAGGDVSCAVMAGDHRNDVLAAHGARVPCVFAAWGYGPLSMGADADAVARDFPELGRIVRRLAGGGTGNAGGGVP